MPPFRPKRKAPDRRKGTEGIYNIGGDTQRREFVHVDPKTGKVTKGPDRRKLRQDTSK